MWQAKSRPPTRFTLKARDNAEQIIVRTFTRADVEALLDAGLLADAFTALPLLYYLRRSALS